MRKTVFFVLLLLVGVVFSSDPVNATNSLHIDPDRQDPWNNCTSCHAGDLLGGFTGVACIDCHNDFSSPDPPPTGHHQPGRDDPFNNCTACHGGDLMGGIGPSCFTCHGELWGSNDSDQDGISDNGDNCPDHPNGPNLGTCIHGALGEICTDNGECGPGGFCSMNQEDDFPPGGNGIGEACECEGNFDFDQDVDGTDAARFKSDFGRSAFSNPCPGP